MNRNEMIDVLMPAIAQCGEALAPARRRLWRMSTSALHRELLMRGLLDYEDPPEIDECEDCAEQYQSARTLFGLDPVPVYAD